MLSRRHIRVKVMQALYMYYNGREEAANLPQLNRSTDKSITRLYELYLYLILFLEELGNFALHYEEEIKGRYLPNEKELRSSNRLFNNPVLQKIMNSDSFHKAVSKYQVIWQGDQDMLRRIIQDLKNQEMYQDYAKLPADNHMLDQEVLNFILKHYTTHFALLQQHFEEQFINWHDDRRIALQMATKTVQSIGEGEGDTNFLQPLSQNDDENFVYAHELLEKTILHDEELNKIVSARISKWEPHQVAVIDNIILKMAVCEFLYFPSIPTKVTINEYIELAKAYSTPQSKKFVNGVLDAIQKELKKDGIMLK